jgi:hypothetical protein
MSDDKRTLIEWAKGRERGFAESAAKEATLRERTLAKLLGGLWHTTHPDRFDAILKSGAILPEPNIPDNERWGALADREHLPYVRFLGGVSLFEFEGFDPEPYRERCPSSCWAYFVPFHSVWERAVWIEIDRSKMTPPTYISGSELLNRWKAESAYGHNFMPEIEAAYLGPLPRAAFKRAFLVCKENAGITELAV